jgi:folate-binding protein YgfZ
VSNVTPLAELQRAAGASFEPYFGVQLPAQFHDAAEEHRTARQTSALIDTNFRAVFSLSGADRARYLNAITTGNIRDLAPGQGNLGLLLNAQGHILAELETLALEDRFILLGHELVREQTFATLDKYIIMDDAVLRDQTAESGTLAVEGPAAPEIVRELTGVELSTLPLDSHFESSAKISGKAGNAAGAGTIPCRIIRHSLFGFPGAEFLVRREAVAALWSLLETAVRARNGAPIGYRALNSLRLEAGIAWFGSDFDQRHIPHEAALEATHISFTKGCYTGQEIVERVRSRGHVNRRLTGLAFAAAAPPEPESKLTADGTEAGNVTSSAFSPLLGKPIGFGYVRREFGTVGTKLRCGDTTAEVIELPFPGALPEAQPASPSAPAVPARPVAPDAPAKS